MEQPHSPLFQDWLQPDLTWLSGLVSNPHPSLSTWLLSNAEAVLYKLSQPRNNLSTVLSMNPAAIPFLLQHPTLISPHGILFNSSPWALSWIQPILDQMTDPSFDFCSKRESVLYALSRNENPLVVKWLEDYVPLEHQYWYCLSMNPSAIDFLLEHPEHIDWTTFTSNSHPRAIQYMTEHPEIMEIEPYSYSYVMLRNQCPDAGLYLRSIGREEMYQGWAYRYGTLEEMDLEHIKDDSLNAMAENPKALSYFKERSHLIPSQTYQLASNPAIFL